MDFIFDVIILKWQFASLFRLRFLEIRLCWNSFLDWLISYILDIRIHACINFRISWWLVEPLFFLLFWRFITIFFFLLVSFIEEGEVIGIFLFSILSCHSCFFWHFIILILLFIFWSYLMVTHTFITYISSHMTWCLILSISYTNIMHIFVTWKSRSIFMITVLISNSSSSRCGSSLTCGVTCSTLIVIVISRFLLDILSLTNLRACNLHAFCLLNEKHVSMVTWLFHYFWSCTSAFNIHSETLIWLKILRTGRIITVINFVVWIILVIILLAIRRSISCSESTKSWRIHLFLE